MLSRLNDKFYGQWLMLHVPFRDPEDFHVPVAAALDRIPAEHRNFAMVVLCEHPTAKAMWRTDAGALEAELRMEALSRPFVTTLLVMATAHRELVHKYLTGAADVRSEERRRDRLRARPDTDQDTGTAFNADQRHLQAKLTAAVERALAVQQTVTEADADELLQEAYDQGKIFVCTGGPGTGKTTTALAAVRRTLNLGGEVLFTYPTNRQASRMRAKLPATVAVDTFHAAFALDEPPGAVLPALARYALIVVDEISQLQQPHFEHICKLWNQADNLPAILMAGDELQMAGFGPTRAWHSPLWRRMIYRVKLHKTYRCKDPAFNRVLQELRTSRPGANTLKWLRGRKAWAPPQSPSVDGIRKLLKAHPDTIVLTCTRRGAQTINDLALRALFPRHDPLAVLPADVESNSKNYQDGALLQDLSALEPASVADLPRHACGFHTKCSQGRGLRQWNGRTGGRLQCPVESGGGRHDYAASRRGLALDRPGPRQLDLLSSQGWLCRHDREVPRGRTHARDGLLRLPWCAGGCVHRPEPCIVRQRHLDRWSCDRRTFSAGG